MVADDFSEYDYWRTAKQQSFIMSQFGNWSPGTGAGSASAAVTYFQKYRGRLVEENNEHTYPPPATHTHGHIVIHKCINTCFINESINMESRGTEGMTSMSVAMYGRTYELTVKMIVSRKVHV